MRLTVLLRSIKQNNKRKERKAPPSCFWYPEKRATAFTSMMGAILLLLYLIIYGLTLVSFFSGTSTCVSATLIEDVRRTSRAPHHPTPVSNRHTASHGFSDVIYGLEKSKQTTKTQQNANKITDLPTYSEQEMSTADEPTKTDISKIASSKTIYRNPTKRSIWSLPGYSLPYKHNKMNYASLQQVAVGSQHTNDYNGNNSVNEKAP